MIMIAKQLVIIGKNIAWADDGTQRIQCGQERTSGNSGRQGHSVSANRKGAIRRNQCKP